MKRHVAAVHGVELAGHSSRAPVHGSAARHGRIPALSRFALEHLLLLPAGAALALVWANAGPESYFRFSYGARFWVNDVAMAIFFGLIMKEVVEATAPGGVLHSWRRSALPIAAGAGAVVVPAILQVQISRALGEPMLGSAWLVAGAVDLALAYAVARLVFRPAHPAIPFVLLLGIAANAVTLGALAVLHPARNPQPLVAAVLMAAALTAAAGMRRARVRSFWPYIAGAGALAWVGLFAAGTHTALALVPIVALMPHARRDPGFFADANGRARDPLTKFERWWTLPAQGILFLFGLVNGGVLIASLEQGLLAGPLATLAGRPIGVLVCVAPALAIGLRLPTGIGVRELTVLSIASAAGFTFALFVAGALLGPGQLLAETRMGVLLGAGAAPLAVLAARLLRVGRFALPASA